MLPCGALCIWWLTCSCCPGVGLPAQPGTDVCALGPRSAVKPSWQGGMSGCFISPCWGLVRSGIRGIERSMLCPGEQLKCTTLQRHVAAMQVPLELLWMLMHSASVVPVLRYPLSGPLFQECCCTRCWVLTAAAVAALQVYGPNGELLYRGIKARVGIYKVRREA